MDKNHPLGRHGSDRFPTTRLNCGDVVLHCGRLTCAVLPKFVNNIGVNGLRRRRTMGGGCFVCFMCFVCFICLRVIEGAILGLAKIAVALSYIFCWRHGERQGLRRLFGKNVTRHTNWSNPAGAVKHDWDTN
jgi:hypothetical protein